MNSLPEPNLIEPPKWCDQDGQNTHNVAAFSGPFQTTEPSNTAYQSWRDIADNPSQTGTSVPMQRVSELSRYGNDTTSGSAIYRSIAWMNQWISTGHGISIPQQESGLTEGYPTTRSGNSLINDDDPDNDSFGCLRATYKGVRLILQNFKQLATGMMAPNEEQISRGPNFAVRRNPNIGIVCNSRVQISCCHIVCLPFNDGRCQVCKEPVEDMVERL